MIIYNCMCQHINRCKFQLDSQSYIQEYHLQKFLIQIGMKRNTFNFTNEQLRKINSLLPLSYKFITKEELDKRDTQKIAKKKQHINLYIPNQMDYRIKQEDSPGQILRVAPLPQVKTEAPSASISHVIPVTKTKSIKQEIIPMANITLFTPAISNNEAPIETSQQMLQKMQKHPAYSTLYNLSKKHQSDISLRQIEIKVASGGQKYGTGDFQVDFQKFCLSVYKNSVRNSKEYRDTVQIEHYLSALSKLGKNGQRKKDGPGLGRPSLGAANAKKKIMAPVKGSVYEPIAQAKMPSNAQKKILGQMIKKLPSQSLQHVCFILFDSTQNREYHFDLDTLHVKKFRQLQQYVKKCMEKTGQWDQKMFEDDQVSNQSQFIIDNDDD